MGTSSTDKLGDITRRWSWRWKEILYIECLKLAVRLVIVALTEDHHVLNEASIEGRRSLLQINQQHIGAGVGAERKTELLESMKPTVMAK